MFENEQHRSCFGKYLVSSFGSCFIYYEKHVNPFDGFFHIIRGRVLMYNSMINEQTDLQFDETDQAISVALTERSE